MEEPINNLFNHVLNGNIKAYTNTLFFLNYFNINGIIGTLSHLNLVMFSLKVIHPLIKTSNSNLGVEKKKKLINFMRRIRNLLHVEGQAWIMKKFELKV